MAIPHAAPGMPLNLLEDGESRAEPRTNALVKNQAFEAIRLVIPRGREVPQHQVDGPITVHCLEGRVDFACGGRSHDLKAGYWLFLTGGEPHSLTGVEDSVVLLTILFPRGGGAT